MTHVVKPKGGNWLLGSVEENLEGLKQSDLIKNVRYFHGPEFEKAREARIENLKQKGDEASLRIAKHLEDNIEEDKAKGALNQWVDKNLTNYVKNQMVRLMIQCVN
jgi:predicted HicB family RNase H-like nuclease